MYGNYIMKGCIKLKYTNQGWMPYIQSMRVPEPMYAIVDMTEQQLEEMYPRIYFIIYPAVCYQCDMMDAEHGDMYVPHKEEFDEMVEDIHTQVSDDMEENKNQGVEIKQWRRDSGELRDLISIIFLRELLQRRRRRPRRYDDDYRRGPDYGRGPGYGRGYGDYGYWY